MSTQQRMHNARLTRQLGQFWTVANMLSLLRAALVLPITYLIFVRGSLAWVLGLIIVAVVTDWFDGSLARWSHTVSDWGKVLDPLADKFAALAIIAALVFRPAQPAEPQIPFWFLALILVRDSLIVAGAVFLTRRTGKVQMSNWWGKAATTALAITVLAALLNLDAPLFQFCLWATTALMIYAYLIYLFRFFQVLRSGRLASPKEGSQNGAFTSANPEAPSLN